MTNDLNPIFRTFRLAYRATRTPLGQDVLAFAGLIAFCSAAIFFLTLTCVALHGADVCFNSAQTQTF